MTIAALAGGGAGEVVEGLGIRAYVTIIKEVGGAAAAGTTRETNEIQARAIGN